MSEILLKPKQKIWKREFEFSKQPKFWKSFALELYSCAGLLERNWDFFNNDKDVKGGIQEQFFFAPKFTRMLWGFALENLMKGILLANDKNNKYINKSGRISWGKNGHDLIWLKTELQYSPSIPDAWEKLPTEYTDVDFYLEVWSISATWYGKYPFPTGINGVLNEYKSLPSQEALIKRRLSDKRKLTADDLLHTDINRFEKELFEIIFKELSIKIDEVDK